MLQLTIPEIILRLVLAMVMGGAIGFERQYKNRPAGMRTHILVCMGAAIIALIQSQIAINALKDALANPALTGVIRSDQARLIAQVVSGIGFLGAGTIIVTKQSVTGLTTAASLWTVAGLGIAVGMGYYTIALTSFIGVLFALTIVKRIIHVPTIKKLEIRYQHKQETKEFINQYFEEKHIEISKVTGGFQNDSDMKTISEKFKNDYSIINHNNILLEFIPKGYNKAVGIDRLIKEIGIPKEDTYAFGDSFNDIDMLNYVEYGCLMGNGDQELKNKVEYKTDRFDEGGIYNGLKKFELI